MKPRSVLILGSSNVNFSHDGRHLSGLVQGRLNAAGHVDWTVWAEIAHPSRSMAKSAVRLADEHEADVVVVAIAAFPFTYEFVVNRVRRRWPVLYRPVLALSQTMKRVAGGESEPQTSPRSLIYRIPEAVALRLIGGETSITVEHAIENTTAALEALAQLEDTAVIVRLPVGGMRASRARAARYEERLSRFRSAISEVCRHRHMPVVDVAAELRFAGKSRGHGFDGIHLDHETRNFEAELLARAILAAVSTNAAFPAAPLS